MKLFCTRWVLTEGIQEFEGELPTEGDLVKMDRHTYLHGEGKDWHKTLEAAQKRAEEVRLRKILSVKKLLQKLEGMKF